MLDVEQKAHRKEEVVVAGMMLKRGGSATQKDRKTNPIGVMLPDIILITLIDQIVHKIIP